MWAWNETEIDLCRKLQIKQMLTKSQVHPARGSFFFSKTPSEANEIAPHIFISTTSEIPPKAVWLPTLDECLETCRALNISFAQITDYIHRKRFADGREREGIYNLLLDVLR